MDDTVEIGEMKVQYTAHGAAAKDEIDEFRRELRAMVASLEESNPMLETYSFPEFDSRLSWGELTEDAGKEKAKGKDKKEK